VSRIFIDIGGYEGDAVWAALDPLFGFECVICYEPDAGCAARIRDSIRDPRLSVVTAALSDHAGMAQLYGPGSLAGSLFSDHRDVDGARTSACEVHRATDLIARHSAEGATIYLKLNCEGAEVPIVADLLRSGEWTKIRDTLLDLDARKIPSLATDLAIVEAELAKQPSRNWSYPEDVQYGQQCTYGGIRNWLKVRGAIQPGFLPRWRSILFHCRQWRARRFRGYYKFLIVKRLPASWMAFYYRSIRPKIARGTLSGH
jgi:FkbM family methyltransferase